MNLSDLKLPEKVLRLGMFVPSIIGGFERENNDYEEDVFYIHFKNSCLNDIAQDGYWDDFRTIVDTYCEKYNCKAFIGKDIDDENKFIAKIFTVESNYKGLVLCIYEIVLRFCVLCTTEENFSADLFGGTSVMFWSPTVTLLCGLGKTNPQREFTKLYFRHFFLSLNKSLPQNMKCFSFGNVIVTDNGAIHILYGDFEMEDEEGISSKTEEELEEYARTVVFNIRGLLIDVVNKLADFAFPDFIKDFNNIRLEGFNE